MSLGIRELVEIDADILAGESTATQIAERYEVSYRTIERRRALLRANGMRVRVPTPEAAGALGAPVKAKYGRW